MERTDSEILERIKARRSVDWLGVEVADLALYLSAEAVKTFLPEELYDASWKPLAKHREALLAQMLEYMQLAWQALHDCDGVAASRNMSHFSVWVWMLGDDLGELLNYEGYGRPHLVAICERYDLDWKLYAGNSLTAFSENFVESVMEEKSSCMSLARRSV